MNTSPSPRANPLSSGKAKEGGFMLKEEMEMVRQIAIEEISRALFSFDGAMKDKVEQIVKDALEYKQKPAKPSKVITDGY